MYIIKYLISAGGRHHTQQRGSRSECISRGQNGSTHKRKLDELGKSTVP